MEFAVHGPDFVTTMLRMAGERGVTVVVKGPTGRPTWAREAFPFARRGPRLPAACRP